MVYIPNNDKEYDNVFVVTEDDETFKISFKFRTKKIRVEKQKTYHDVPNLQLQSKPEYVRLNKKKLEILRQEQSNKSIAKRFRLIFLMALGLIAISFSTLLINIGLFFKSTDFICLCLFLWFLDYKMLQNNKYYCYCFLIATVVAGYGILMTHLFSDMEIIPFFICPIFYLIGQKPLRLIFKKILKREPVIEKDPPSFLDAIYAMLLFVLPFLVLFIYIR
jgi:hypothetical protein